VNALAERVLQCLAAYPPAPHYWLAYSGGLDSHVLLHSIAKQRAHLFGAKLTAVHVNHQLQADAWDWVEHCRAQATQLQLDFVVLTVDVQRSPGVSPEAAARTARYRALQNRLAPNEMLLSAHHQNDQAETLLLQLLRGSGPAGLAAMPERRVLGQGWLLRPLLGCHREELLAYAKTWGLHWIEDPSNRDERFERNLLRHRIMPLLRQHWPAVEKNLARSAQLTAEAAELLSELGQQDLIGLVSEQDNSLAWAPLTALSAQRRRNALRCWLRTLGLNLPSQAQLVQIDQQMQATRQDAQPAVTWSGGEVRRYRDRLYALPPISVTSTKAFDPEQIIPWPSPNSLHVVGVGCLQWVEQQSGGLAPDVLRAITVRFRQGGERFRPQGRRHSQRLKQLLQERGIPPWQRDRLPLIYSGEQLVWVPGLGPAAQYCVAEGQTGLRLQWHKTDDSASL